MTVRCILCRGRVIYKNGDITRFTSHLANEHGAFFDIEYLLASCFLDESQKRAIADPVVSSQIPPTMMVTQAQNPAPMMKHEYPKQEIAQDTSAVDEQIRRELADELFESVDKEIRDIENGVNMNETAEMERMETKSENLESKGTPESVKKKRECNLCGKVYNSLQGLSYHKKNHHSNGEEGVKQEREKVTENDMESPKQRKDVVPYDTVVKQLMSEGIDIRNSAYFSKQKEVITLAGNTEAKFVDVIPFLPEGWKFRSYEAKQKERIVLHKNYLTPSKFVLKYTMGVVEYLRLEGKMKPEEILEVAKNLKVGPSKLKRLFSNESHDDSTNTEETIAEA